jgi:chromate transporter
MDLFLGFFKLGALAFGGAGPMMRSVIVEDRRWLDDAEFAALLGCARPCRGSLGECRSREVE